MARIGAQRPARAADRDAMLAALAEVDAVVDTVLAAGGATYVDRHHERGKLTALSDLKRQLEKRDE